MNKIENFVKLTNDIDELYDYVSHLKSREDRLIAIKAINDLKAKDKNFSKSERLTYLELQLNLLDIVCTDDLDEINFLENKEQNGKIIIHPLYPINREVVDFVKNVTTSMRKKILKIRNS